MIKNEYMKLSRDVSHRKFKGDHEAEVDGVTSGINGADSDGKKVLLSSDNL